MKYAPIFSSSFFIAFSIAASFCDAWSATTTTTTRMMMMMPTTTTTTIASNTRATVATTSLHMSRNHKQRREERNRYKNDSDMLDFIDEPMSSVEMVGDEVLVRPEDDELADLVRCIVKAADGRKADNIVAMRISKISTVTSFVVIATGNSRPQNQAITAVVKDDVNEEFSLLPGATGVPEGTADSGWSLLDYGSVMVHVMTPKSRLFYNLEGRWKDQGAEYMDITDEILPNSPIEQQQPQQEREEKGTMQGLSEEEDPFWS